MINDFIKPVVVLAAICVVVAGALALVNDATHPIIEEAAAERAIIAMQDIIPKADVFDPMAIDGLENIAEAYEAINDSGELIGYIFVVTNSKGYGGIIRVMCGIDLDGRIIGLRALQHSETKGFGDYIDYDHPSGFINRWTGKDSRLEGIDGVSGATITYKAFRATVEDAFKAFDGMRN